MALGACDQAEVIGSDDEVAGFAAAVTGSSIPPMTTCPAAPEGAVALPATTGAGPTSATGANGELPGQLAPETGRRWRIAQNDHNSRFHIDGNNDRRFDVRDDWVAIWTNPESYGNRGLGVRRRVGGPNGPWADRLATFFNGTWVVDGDGDMSITAIDPRYTFGQSEDQPVSGNWSATGIGVFRNGVWYLDRSGDGRWSGAADTTYWFGKTGDLPVVGDWTGDGRSKIGVARQSTAGLEFYLDWNGNGRWDCGDRSTVFRPDARSSRQRPIVGPWDGGPADRIGLVSGDGGPWFFDVNGNGIYDRGDAMRHPFDTWGHPIVGDFRSPTRPLLTCTYHVNTGSRCHDHFENAAPVADVLTLRLRSDPNDPNAFEELYYETEYKASLDCRFPTKAHQAIVHRNSADAPDVGRADRIVVSAGRSQANVVCSRSDDSVVEPQLVSLTANQPLRVRVNDVATVRQRIETWRARMASAQIGIRVTPLYSAPTAATLDTWDMFAEATATILNQSVELYTLWKQHRETAVGDALRLELALADADRKLEVAQLELARLAAEAPDSEEYWVLSDDIARWSGLRDMLANTMARQGTPQELSAALDGMVQAARDQMLFRADRARALLALMAQSQLDLEVVAASALGAMDGLITKLRQVRSSSGRQLESALAQAH